MNLLLYKNGIPTADEIRAGVKPSPMSNFQKVMTLTTNEAAYYHYQNEHKKNTDVNWDFIITDRLKKIKDLNL